MVVTPAVQPVQTAFCYTPAPREERTDIQRLLQRMAADDSRALLIYSYLEHELLDGHACLVLAQSLGHTGKAVCAGAARRAPRGLYQWGEQKSRPRRGHRRHARGTLRCLFATYQLAKEGLDIPRRGQAVSWPVPCGTALSYSKAPDVSMSPATARPMP